MGCAALTVSIADIYSFSIRPVCHNRETSYYTLAGSTTIITPTSFQGHSTKPAQIPRPWHAIARNAQRQTYNERFIVFTRAHTVVCAVFLPCPFYPPYHRRTLRLTQSILYLAYPRPCEYTIGRALVASLSESRIDFFMAFYSVLPRHSRAPCQIS